MTRHPMALSRHPLPSLPVCAMLARLRLESAEPTGPDPGGPNREIYGVSDTEGTGNTEDCIVEYSSFHTTLENIPYALMLLLGSAIIVLGLGGEAWTWLAAVGFVLYGIAGSFWIIIALCPHCPSYGQRSCPCGYGVMAARLRPKGDAADFTRRFRQTIPTIVPLWFVPVIIAAIALIKAFALPIAILAGVFVLNSFVILPWLSRGHGCKDCPQRDLCPWWSKKAVDQAATG